MLVVKLTALDDSMSLRWIMDVVMKRNVGVGLLRWVMVCLGGCLGLRWVMVTWRQILENGYYKPQLFPHVL